MYASFFGLRELPFNNTPVPRFFFSTPDHEEALACLIYAITEGKGFVLLTGEVGAGKTLITRLMLRNFGERLDFAVINHTQVSAEELLQTICAEFRVEVPAGASNAELIRRLQDYLLARYAADRSVVLMLDEAQSLSREAFEQVRMIGNLEADSAKLLQIVIVGQPELRERFEADDMRQLRQRIFRSFHLGGLTREQTEGYIRHRLSVAGAPYPDRIFAPEAIDAIFRYAQGLPRLINTACDNAMLSAFAADQAIIEAPFINQVISQMVSVSQKKPHFAPPAVPHLGAEAENTARFTAAGATDLLHREGIRRFATDLQIMHDDCTRALSQYAQELRREYAKLLEADARRVRAGLIDAHLEEKAAATAHDLRTLVERGETLRRRLDEMIAATRAIAPPQLRDARKVTQQLRHLLEEAHATEQQVRKAVAAATAVSGSTEHAAAALAQQSSRTSRLCLALRGVFDKLEDQSGLARRSAADRPVAGKPVVPVAGGTVNSRRLRQRAEALEAQIAEQREVIAGMRSLIEANQPPAPAATDRSSDSELRLTREVQGLVELVHGTSR
jgi:general secretion pathway protein A